MPPLNEIEILEIFPGAIVIERTKSMKTPAICRHCNKDHVPRWRRGGKIIQMTEPDGTACWGCQFCGRRTNNKIKTVTSKKSTTK